MIKTSVEAWGAKETVLDDKGVTYIWCMAITTCANIRFVMEWR